MSENLIIKKLSRVDVQQKRIVSLDCSLPLLHWHEQTTDSTFQNFLSSQDRIRTWNFESHGMEKKPYALWEYQREFIWALCWDKIRVLCFAVTICTWALQSTTISIQMSSQNKAASPDQKHRGHFQPFPWNIDEHHVFLQNFWFHQTTPRWGKKNYVFFRKVREGSVHHAGMVRGKRFCRSCKQYKIRPINPTAILVFSVHVPNLVISLHHCFVLIHTYVKLESLPPGCSALDIFNFLCMILWFFSLHFALIYLFNPIYRVFLSVLLQLHWRFSHLAISTKKKRKFLSHSIALLMLNLQLHVGVRCFHGSF